MADDEGAANRQEQFDHGEENGRRDGEEVREEEDGDGAEDSSPDDSGNVGRLCLSIIASNVVFQTAFPKKKRCYQ